MYNISYFTEEKMIDWENKSEADQANMAIVKTHFTKFYREHLQYPKASQCNTRFNKRAMQNYEEQQSKEDDDATALMFAQTKTRHQEQMESMKEAMQSPNECLMKMVKNQTK